MGIYKSLKNRKLNSTDAKIFESKIAEGDDLLGKFPPSPEEVKTVLSAFEQLS